MEFMSEHERAEHGVLPHDFIAPEVQLALDAIRKQLEEDDDN